MKNYKYNIKILSIITVGIVLTVLLFSYFYTPSILWKENDKKMYNVSMQIDTRSRNLVLNTFSNNKHEITGIFNLKIIKISSKIISVCYQFSNLEVTESGKRNLNLEILYSTPFIVEFNKNGKIVNYHFPNTLAIEDELMIIGIIKEFQIVVPRFSFFGWNTDESDATGQYTASYKIKRNIITKGKTKYKYITNIDNQETKDLSVNIKKSWASFVLSKKSSWLEDADLDETITIGDKKTNSLSIRSKIVASMREVDFNPDNALFIWKNNDIESIKSIFLSGNKNQIPYTEQVIIAQLKEKYKNEDLNEILNKLNKNNLMMTALKLNEYLRAFRSELSNIHTYFIDKHYTQQQRIILIYALGMTNLKESQPVLIDIINDENIYVNIRDYAITIMGNYKYPTQELIDSLYNISNIRDNENAKQLSDTAFLTLGILADRVNSFNKDTGEQIKIELLSRLEDKNQDDEKSLILIKALSNINDDSLIPVFEKYSESPNQYIKASAISAFSKFNNEKSMEIILDHLDAEDDPYIKSVVVDTLIRKPSNNNSIAKIEKNVLTESNENVRYKMLQYLVDNRQNYASVKETLQTCLEKNFTQKEKALIYKGLYSKNYNNRKFQ